MATLRIIGDVHGQIDPENLFTRNGRPYLDLISAAAYSIQVGDMGDRETYELLIANVDANRHRFFPGNHDCYDWQPPHSLGDFGAVCWGGVDFFFIRGAASTDKEKLLRVGREVGRTLWYAQEELTEKQMLAAEQAYLQARPKIVLSHDGPTDIARFAWQHARRSTPPNPEAVFRASRTSDFLMRLIEQHAPRLWLFGHHHYDWRYREHETVFVCVGELSYVDIDAAGIVFGT